MTVIIAVIVTLIVAYVVNRIMVANLKEKNRIERTRLFDDAYIAGYDDGIERGELNESLRRALDSIPNE